MINKSSYINAKTFKDFCNNQATLIDILNHRISKMEINVKWISRIGYYMATMLTAIAIKSIVFT